MAHATHHGALVPPRTLHTLAPYGAALWLAWLAGSVMLFDMTDETAMTVEDVADRLSVTPQTLRKIIAAGELQAYRIGRNYRIFEADLRAYLDRAMNEAARTTEQSEFTR